MTNHVEGECFEKQCGDRRNSVKLSIHRRAAVSATDKLQIQMRLERKICDECRGRKDTKRALAIPSPYHELQAPLPLDCGDLAVQSLESIGRC